MFNQLLIEVCGTDPAGGCSRYWIEQLAIDFSQLLGAIGRYMLGFGVRNVIMTGIGAYSATYTNLKGGFQLAVKALA